MRECRQINRLTVSAYPTVYLPTVHLWRVVTGGRPTPLTDPAGLCVPAANSACTWSGRWSMPTSRRLRFKELWSAYALPPRALQSHRCLTR